MSIDKNQLKTDIVSILDTMKTDTGDQQDAINSFADQLSDKIADAIKRGIDTTTVDAILTAGSVAVTGTITLTATK